MATRRKSQHLAVGERDIYVTRNTSLRACRLRARTLVLRKRFGPTFLIASDVVVHAMGAAVSSAVKFACSLQSEFPDRLEISSVNTSSATVVDDLFPTDLDDDIDQCVRCKSTIKIVLQCTIKNGVKPVNADPAMPGLENDTLTRPAPAFVHFQRRPKPLNSR